LFLVPLFFVSMASPAFAELSFTPSISLREEYNDNIFLTADEEEGDFLTTVSPAVDLAYVYRGLDIALDYRLNFDFYAYNPDFNEVRQLGRLDSTVSPYRDVFFIKVSDVYKRVPIDERRQVVVDNVLANATDTNRFLVNPYLEYPLSSTLRARLGYTYENIWYKETDGDDAENNSADLSIIKEVSPKITASLMYTYLSHRPERTEDYDRQDAGFGIKYKVSPRLSLDAGAEQTRFDYKAGTHLDSTSWKIKAGYLFTEALAFSAGYSEGFSDSVNVGAYKRKAATGAVTYKGKNTVSLTAFSNTDDYITIDREDRSRGATLASGIQLTPRITGVFSGKYTYYEFLPGEERVDRYSLALSLNYKLRTIAATLGYTHNLSDSTIDANDYRSNTAWLQVRLAI